VFPLFDKINLIESIGGDFMADIKTCSSCGAGIPVEALFCPNCGQKQEAMAQEPEQATQTPEEPIVEESATETVSGADSQAAPDIFEQEQKEPEAEPASSAEQSPVYPDPASAPQQPASQKTETAQPQPSYWQTQQTQQPQPGYWDTKQSQPAQGYQPPSYPQPASQPVAPKKPKKKFPWVFTIVWIVMLAFIGVWVYLWTTYPVSQNPLTTVLDTDVAIDFIRVIVPVISAILLIYTLFLKISVKKLKVIPTILLIIFFLASVFMFLSFELVEGDWPNDLIRPVAEMIFEDLL